MFKLIVRLIARFFAPAFELIGDLPPQRPEPARRAVLSGAT